MLRTSGGRRLIWGILAVGLLAGTASGTPGDSSAATPAEAEPSQRPFFPGAARGFNVLLITLDTVRADHLGAYGASGAQTPTIDRLAQQGLRFETVITPAPITLPAHTSLMTCLEPRHHGVRHNGDRLPQALASPTLAQQLFAAGYDTAAFVSAFVLDRRFGLDRGFVHYDDQVNPAKAGFPSGILERSGSDTVDAASVWLARHQPDQPFFLWVHLFDAHAPYQPAEPYRSQFAQRLYDGEIASVDAEVGRLLALLDAKGWSTRTLVVVAADHGEGLGEHGEQTHAFFLYDSTLRVPLILWSGGLRSPVTVVRDRVGSLIDVSPTILRLLGQPRPEVCDGIDLLGPVPEDRLVLAESLSPYLDFGWAPLSALRDLRRKAIQAPRPEYYDLVADPGEAHDVVLTKSGAKAAAPLLSRLRVLASEDSSLSSRSNPSDPEERAALAALGYAGGGGGLPTGSPNSLADPKDRVAVVAAMVEANSLAEAGRLDEAVRLLRQTMIASGSDRSTLWAMAKLLLRVGREPEAERALRRLEAGTPTADQLLLLAQLLARDVSRREEAAGLLDRATALDPKHGGILIARGDLAAARGDHDQATAFYQTARTTDPYRAGAVAIQRLDSLAAGDTALVPR